MLRAALIGVLAVVALVACTPITHVEGHKIRATAASADALHEGAPAWFGAWWGDYLRHARPGGYAVLALDRNGRGGWYVYCATGGCHVLDNPFARPVKDVHYTYRALERCREAVAEAHPADRPDCALYAIKDKIIWQGPLPWAGAEDATTRPTRRAAVGATPDLVGPNMALDAIAFWRIKWLVD